MFPRTQASVQNLGCIQTDCKHTRNRRQVMVGLTFCLLVVWMVDTVYDLVNDWVGYVIRFPVKVLV